MKSKAAEDFFHSAVHYCNLIELFNTADEINKLNKLLASLSDLYSKALYLPEVESENIETVSFDLDLPQVNFEQYEIYWEIFEPYHLEEPVCGSLTDDILDIYKDVKEGILLYERNEHLEAIWHWKFHFEAHWGRHVVDAIRALHSANFK